MPAMLRHRPSHIKETRASLEELSLTIGAGSDSFRPRRVLIRNAHRASFLLSALLGDVFADDELAGGASAELLQGEAAHQLLVGGRALGACAGQEAEEPADQRAHLGLEADDVQQV